MLQSEQAIEMALAPLAAGKWLVGVSGGRDSVAMLVALRTFRPDLDLTAVHLNHQARGHESDLDSLFVQSLCASLAIKCIVRRIDELALKIEANVEARFRAARLMVFRVAMIQHGEHGVLLAHHADDRAETILLRLLRHTDPSALDSLYADAVVENVRVVRPFIRLRREQLDAYLQHVNQRWRDDSSNTSDAFARNRVRAFLAAHPEWTARLLVLADAAQQWRNWIESTSPTWGDSIPLEALADLPDPAARFALRRWLRAQSIDAESVSPEQIDSLVAMARDRSTPASANLPGGRTLRRRGSVLELDHK